MANKKDFSIASRGLLGLEKPEPVIASETPVMNTIDKMSVVKEAEEIKTKAPEEVSEVVMEKASSMSAGEKQEKKLPTVLKISVSPTNRRKKTEYTRLRTSLELTPENLQFIEDIRTVEGASLREVINGILDDFRINKRAALDKALEIHRQSTKTWRS